MSKTFLYPILVFAAGSSYGLIVPVIKSAASGGIYPASFLPLQYLVAFLVCAAVVAARRLPLRGIGARSALSMMALGLFTGCTSVCYYSSVSLLPSAVALTLLFQYVWVSVIIECIAKRRLPDRPSVIAVLVVLAGTLLSTGIFDGSYQGLDPVGVAFGIASALFYALFLYFSGILGAGQPALVRTSLLALGGLVTTTVANPSGLFASAVEPMLWPYAAGLAFLGILFPTSLINYASPKLSASMVSIMASSELPVGILAAWALVGDAPSPLALVGCALVLAAIVYRQLPKARKQPQP